MPRRHKTAAHRVLPSYYIERADGRRLAKWDKTPFVWDRYGWPFLARKDAAVVAEMLFVGPRVVAEAGIRVVRGRS